MACPFFHVVEESSGFMETRSAGLILESGGMRGVYTAGVLRFFMDRDLIFPYVIGVSIGACNAANYVARQPERNKDRLYALYDQGYGDGQTRYVELCSCLKADGT
jgi:predicted patatin/cPLA2 family phospholipase